jgi:hypothetical protein
VVAGCCENSSFWSVSKTDGALERLVSARRSVLLKKNLLDLINVSWPASIQLIKVQIVSRDWDWGKTNLRNDEFWLIVLKLKRREHWLILLQLEKRRRYSNVRLNKRSKTSREHVRRDKQDTLRRSLNGVKF